jgi:N-acetylneuraminate lyase
MTDTNRFGGVIPAVVTPLTSEDKLSVASFERLIEHMYEAGSTGIYVCGQTGEGLSLPLDVRMHATEVAVRNTPAGRSAIIHIGAANTGEAVTLAKHAARSGAHAVSSLPPNSTYAFDEVKTYYQAIAAAAGVPVLVYYFPEVSRSISTLEQILDLCTIPGVIGLKFTGFDLYRLSLVQRAGPVILNGRDEVFAAGLLMGAHGGIGSFYNLVPELFVSVYEHARAGRWSEARNVQDRISDLIRAVLRLPMLAAIKSLLTASGIECGFPVAPRRPLTADEEVRLQQEIRKAGYEPAGFLAGITA